MRFRPISSRPPGATAPVALMATSCESTSLPVARQSEVGGRPAEVDPAVRGEDDVVLDAQIGAEEADRVPAADPDAGARDDGIAAEVGDEAHARELDADAGARRVAGGERQDDGLVDVEQRAAPAPRGAGAPAPLISAKIVHRDADRLRDHHRRAQR